MKFKWEWIAPFFPAVLGVVIVTILDALGIIQFKFTNDDVDTLVILSGLILTIILASVLLSREAVRQMRLVSLRQAQQEYNAERSRFLRRLDHELKNPLMGIQLALANAATTDEDTQARQKNRDGVQQQLTRLSRIITDLRKMADLGTQTLERFPVNLTDLLQEIYNLAVEETPANERVLQLSVPEAPLSLPNVMGDQDLLLLAIYNLLNNALKYTRNGDTVALRAYTQDEFVAIEVRDTGIGIAPSDLPYIWDELYRSEQVRDIPGSGIGLALVKLIIERHGGTIQITSQIERGATVTVRLPIPRSESEMNTFSALRPVSVAKR